MKEVMVLEKILLLGGSTQQVPAIKCAASKGYYTILCDYLPDNPGQYFVDKFYCVSTTDQQAVLEIAIEEKISGIVAYASDPAAPTASYVSEKLNLFSNSYHSVNILANKDEFRSFLKLQKFNTPESRAYQSYEEGLKDFNHFKMPVMIKPVDSSGSKGVTKVDNIRDYQEAYKLAEKNSRKRKVIVEEYISKDHPYMIAGDCFVVDGKVEYWGLLNSHRDDKINPYVPIGTSYPLHLEEDRIKQVKKETQKLFKALNIKSGAFNIEILIDNKDKLYFIEVGPRNGGNMIPDLLYMATGEDMIAATIDSALGLNVTFNNIDYGRPFVSTYVLHSEVDGLLEEIAIDDKLEEKIINKIYYKEYGDRVERFDGANKALGIIFLKFNSQSEQLEFYNNPRRWITIRVIKDVENAN